MLFESGVQLDDDGVGDYSVFFAAIEVVVFSAVRLDYLERQFYRIKNTLVVLFFKEPIYKVFSRFALISRMARTRQCEDAVFAPENLG